ncbi:MAG: DUF2087 domain-containing protein [Bacillota bacterium]
MNLDERFWDATIDELCSGYIFETQKKLFKCLICGKEFEKGIIYRHNDSFMEAEKAVAMHIEAEHDSMFHYFLQMDKKYTGLTDHQKLLLRLFYEGYSDKEIIGHLGGGSTSTIRNHRFTLKEKEKQAKIYLTIMELLNKSTQNADKLVNIHRGATMVDERYSVTEQEKQKIIDTYFDKNEEGKLKTFPGKEKKKIVILQHIMQRFDKEMKYTEKEINTILESIYSDYVTIRRYLIEYGFMERTKDCSLYWVK